MRKILMLLVLIVSIQSFGQGPKLEIPEPVPIYSHLGDIIFFGVPPNYQYRVVYERLRGMMPDSAFHLPRYNGVPVGLRGGSSNNDGALAADTLNGHIYHYWNTAWNRLANYSDLATASRFGVEDARAGQNRIFTGLNNTYSLALDSLDYFRVDRNGVTRIYQNSSTSSLYSPDGNTQANVLNNLVQLSVGSASNYLWGRVDSFLTPKRISYTHNINGSLTDYSLITKRYADSLATAGGVNIYNSNGTITATRTVSLNTLILNIQQSSILRTSFGPTGFSSYYDNGTRVGSLSIEPGNGLMSSYATDELGLASYVQTIDSLILSGSHAGFGRQSKIVIKDSSIRFTSSLGRYHFPDMPAGAGTHAVRIDATGKLFKADTTSGGGGNVTKVGTPVNDQVGIWTGDGTIEGDADLTFDGTALTGRWKARVGSTTSSATPTINTDVTDIYKLTAQTADITSFTTNLSGTPNDGDVLEIQITGTAARAITWGSSFVATTVALPTTTVTTTTLTVLFQYYTTSSYGNNKWHCVNYY